LRPVSNPGHCQRMIEPNQPNTGIGDVQLFLSFNRDDNSFNLTVTNVKEVSYTIFYTARVDDRQTSEAIAHAGSGEEGIFSAAHVAGTESGEDQILHDVERGGIELIATGEDNVVTKITQSFTIDSDGKLGLISSKRVRDFQGEIPRVLGKSDQQSPSPSPLQPAQLGPSQTVEAQQAQAGPTPAGGLRQLLPEVTPATASLAIGGTIGLLLVMWLLKSIWRGLFDGKPWFGPKSRQDVGRNDSHRQPAQQIEEVNPRITIPQPAGAGE